MSVSKTKATVRQRDNHSCVDCGLTAKDYMERNGTLLDVHRLIPGSRYTVDGCVTVCRSCHKLRHSTRKPKRGRLIADVADGGELSQAVHLRAFKMAVEHNRTFTKSDVIMGILRRALAPELAAAMPPAADAD